MSAVDIPVNDPAFAYSSTAAARLLGVSVATLHRWTDAGEVAHCRTPGGHRRFRLHDLDSFVAERAEPVRRAA
jgi:excisionase family DNA binding protein